MVLSTFTRVEHPLSRAFDHDNSTSWSIWPRVSEPHTAVFELQSPAAAEDGSRRLKVRLESGSGTYPQRNLGRFRLSVTDRAGIAAAQIRRFRLSVTNRAGISGGHRSADGLQKIAKSRTCTSRWPRLMPGKGTRTRPSAPSPRRSLWPWTAPARPGSLQRQRRWLGVLAKLDRAMRPRWTVSGRIGYYFAEHGATSTLAAYSASPGPRAVRTAPGGKARRCRNIERPSRVCCGANLPPIDYYWIDDASAVRPNLQGDTPGNSSASRIILFEGKIHASSGQGAEPALLHEASIPGLTIGEGRQIIRLCLISIRKTRPSRDVAVSYRRPGTSRFPSRRGRDTIRRGWQGESPFHGPAAEGRRMGSPGG